MNSKHFPIGVDGQFLAGSVIFLLRAASRVPRQGAARLRHHAAGQNGF
jgi:hypothetical protein